MHTKKDTDTKAVEAARDDSKSEVALREEAVLAFWREHDIFKKSVEQPAGGEPKGDYVFYDGPPFATGLPHYGHILAGTIKDAVPRFWTMQGYRVRRKWGWDCHGLPLENLIEKELGLATKKDIEEFGIQNFNEKARQAVMRYADDWRVIIPRMGRFVDMDDDYKTMDPSYTESVWWVFKTLHEKGLVYEGFKGMHLCPRCGTTLSNFEVNQGYKDIKDIAVTVKLPLLDGETGEPTDTSLLVWTTTPWTLPGNMAAAVHNEHAYVKVNVTLEEEKQLVILAKERLTQLGTDEYEIVEEYKGADLVGKRYAPPFPYFKDREFENKENAWTIYHADYVELGEEGTGAVHLAPAYGEEDMELAKEHGIPIVHHVDTAGHFMDFVTDFAGQLVKPKDDDKAEVTHLDADIAIVKALKASGRLFKKETITHSYPHCWRCDTPLLNYATTSWFVEVTKFRDRLVKENHKVHWVPGHVGQNRFGKWLEGARDWAVSRQRYWGAPLPIWRNPETKTYKVVGSLNELQAHVPQRGNQFTITRHGESVFNTKGILSADVALEENCLTDTGKEQASKAAQQLVADGGVDLIFHSPLPRTAQTAQLIAGELGLSSDCVIADERLFEMRFGEFEQRPVEEYHAFFGDGHGRLTKQPDGGGESWTEVKERVGEFLFEVNSRYENKRILIVSHNGTLQMLQAVAQGDSHDATAAHIDIGDYNVANAELRALPFVPFPHNDHYELDFHRPYIDQVELYDGEVKLERVPDVFDCWFESGSMPYADRYFARSHPLLGDTPVVTVPLSTTPRASACAEGDLIAKSSASESYDIPFPANFIAESIDQTRGWFYSMMVLGVGLFGKSPYENVITNGLVLAEDGRKMSKSLKNYPDPVELADRQGVDAMRFYLLSSPIIKGEDLNFSEKEVQELQRKNIGRLHNVLAMYETYADDGVESRSDSTHVLDRWIVARLAELVTEVTDGFTNYELDRATRPITDFIDDLSVWYLRRSRDRLKGEDETDKQATLGTLRHTLRTLALVMAPSMPFYAEYLWGRVREASDAESVHLAAWPSAEAADTAVLEEMACVRELISQALEARARAKIKIRQPLRAVLIKEADQQVPDEFLPLVLDEVNVKTLEHDPNIETLVSVDAVITPNLQQEGDARELMRQIQDLRKQAGLQPDDRIALTIQTSDGGQGVVTEHEATIMKTVGADTITFGDASGAEVTAGNHSFTIALQKVG